MQAKAMLDLPNVPLEWLGKAESSGARVLQPLSTWPPQASVARGAGVPTPSGVKKATRRSLLGTSAQPHAPPGAGDHRFASLLGPVPL